ncbi:MAG: hypothetical protein JJU21_12180 [Salinarimonas sp.]|nr:hypothetical protein [Salinarimonas sp.]
MSESELLPRVTYELAQIACELGYVPPPLLSPHVFVDSSRFKCWRSAFSKPLLQRLDSFQCPTVTWLEAGEYDVAGSPFSVGERRALRDRGGFFAFHRIAPESFSSQGRPHVSDAEADIRQCLALEIFRRSAEIDVLLKALDSPGYTEGYLDAFSLLIDKVPGIARLADVKASKRSLDTSKGRADDRVYALLERLASEGQRLDFKFFDKPHVSGSDFRDQAIFAIRSEIDDGDISSQLVLISISIRVSLISIFVKAYLRATLVATTERKLARREAKRAAILKKHPDFTEEVISGKGRLGKKKIEAANRSGDKYDNAVLVDPTTHDSHMLDLGEMSFLATYTGIDLFPFNFSNILFWRKITAARTLGVILRGREANLTREQAEILDRQGPPPDAKSCPIEYAALVAIHENVARATRLLEFGLGVSGTRRLK